MAFSEKSLVPYIPASDYDRAAQEFLEVYYPQALISPTIVPIEDIAKNKLGLDIQYICLSEEHDIFGMTIFTHGAVEIYDPVEKLYDIQMFEPKTILIDPEAIKKTNRGCDNNTIAHECVHWCKHRLYYKKQSFSLPRYAKYCKCKISQLPKCFDDENIMENQAIGIAPRILMPKNTFVEAAEQVRVTFGGDNRYAISALAEIFGVSKQSVSIRLKECALL